MTKGQKKWVIENIPKNKCRYCLSKTNLTYDHKNPLCKGGKTIEGNIQVLCRKCNSIKGRFIHKEILHLARWINWVNQERSKLEKRPLGVHKNKTI